MQDFAAVAAHTVMQHSCEAYMMHHRTTMDSPVMRQSYITDASDLDADFPPPASIFPRPLPHALATIPGSCTVHPFLVIILQ
jgi:hypothetical protein